MPSSFDADHAQEQIITEFLDKSLFSHIFRDYDVVEDKQMQRKGVDVTVRKDGNPTYYDAKAQSSARFINDPRPTFAFEILTDDKYGITREGWFVRDEIMTDKYILCWIKSATVNDKGRIERSDDIHEVEVMILDKEKLRNYVHQYISDEQMLQNAYEMRRSGETRINVADGLTIVHTPTLTEQPVNIVVKKFILNPLSDARYLVRAHKISVI